MRLGFQIFDEPGGSVIEDWSDEARDVIVRTGKNGCESLSCFVPLGVRDSFYAYNYGRVPHVLISLGGYPVWVGRQEDISVTGEGLRPGSFGYWSALKDSPYTALWSLAKYGDWESVSDDEIPTVLSNRWTMDNNNRVYLAPNKDEQFGSGTALGAMAFIMPANGERDVVEVEFSYEVVGASTWQAKLMTYNRSWTHQADEWSATGGSSGTASVTITGADPQIIVFAFRFNSTTATYTGESGDVYFKATSVRIKSTSESSVTADLIAKDIANFIATLNENFSSSDGLIGSPGLDIDNVIYEDAMPTDILNELSGLGDDQTPPRRWVAAVWERSLVFREEGFNAVDWEVDLLEIEVEKSLSELYNAAYAVFDDKERTAVATNTTSIANLGITRKTAVNVSTSSESKAETHRDAYLKDQEGGKARAQILLDGLFDVYGTEHPFYEARAGDTVTIRNLPTNLEGLDAIKTFRLDSTECNLSENTLRLVPADLPTIEFLIARGNL